MATGLIATINGAGTVTYTPQTTGKISVAFCSVAGSRLSINGVDISGNPAAGANLVFNIYVAASVPITFTTTTAGTGLTISSIEE